MRTAPVRAISLQEAKRMLSKGLSSPGKGLWESRFGSEPTRETKIWISKEGWAGNLKGDTAKQPGVLGMEYQMVCLHQRKTRERKWWIWWRIKIWFRLWTHELPVYGSCPSRILRLWLLVWGSPRLNLSVLLYFLGIHFYSLHIQGFTANTYLCLWAFIYFSPQPPSWLCEHGWLVRRTSWTFQRVNSLHWCLIRTWWVPIPAPLPFSWNKIRACFVLQSSLLRMKSSVPQWAL